MSNRVVLERVQASTAGTARHENEQLTRQRVYIFPTAQGWIYAVMLIVMLLGAINYSNSMAFMLCFLLTGLSIVCILYTYRNLFGLIITAGKPESVYQGQTAQFPFQIDNQSGQDRFDIVLRQKPRKSSKDELQSTRFSLAAGKQEAVLFPVPTKHRGLVKTGRLIIETQFPLGIFRAWSWLENDQSCLVYPHAAGDKVLPLKSELEDDIETGKKTGTDDFAGFRKYRPGDATRSIAWIAYAREQGLHVKQFSGSGSETLVLHWDDVVYLDQIEARLSQLCLWILMAEEAGIQYGLNIPGVEIDPGIGEQHQYQCLDKLALFGFTDESG
ncbi:MAG: DUF58 domain-containing protein [Gammaproteobacteria bacterium]